MPMKRSRRSDSATSLDAAKRPAGELDGNPIKFKKKKTAAERHSSKSSKSNEMKLDKEFGDEFGSEWLDGDKENDFSHLPHDGKEVPMPKNEKGWKCIEMDLEMMQMFGQQGGMMIEELDDGDPEYHKYAPRDDSEKLAKLKDEAKMKKKKKKKKNKEHAVATDKQEQDAAFEAVDARAWEGFHLKDCIVRALGLRGFAHPTPIQNACLHPAIAGKDIVGAAETGSGKTLAFGLPILNRIAEREEGKLFAMIILPTRELALQVQTNIEQIAKLAVLPKCTCCLVGGMSLEKQNRVLSLKPPIVIGTPGRVNAMAFGDSIHPWLKDSVKDIKVFVLDEADRLVEPGHFRDLNLILEKVYHKEESKVQTFVFSATLTERDGLLDELFEKVPLRQACCQVDLTRNTEKKTALPENLELCKLTGQDGDREPLLMHFLMEHFRCGGTRKKVLIFCNAISYVYRLASLMQLVFGSNKGSEKLRSLSKKQLAQPLIKAEVFGLHSKMRQQDRFKTMDAFKEGDRCLMITTDLAARGLDISGITTVIHFQVPRNKELFVHRSGRTARAGCEGLALCLVGPEDRDKWFSCTRDIRHGIAKYDEYGTCQSKVLAHCRGVLQVATDLEKALHKKSKKSKEDAWIRRTAEETELVLSDSEPDNDFHEKEHTQKLLGMYNQLQNRLRSLR
eukprot:GEMP01017523.1.p1 GENE.GEMP01017523.1~~GEMP01017523.1.p1  ORF type:complete len:677 (+),score=176.15 GEMP01017523.1:103-2133(+)